MIQRNFIPGSEWLYFKLYTGPKSADRLLADVIRPTATQLQDDQNIKDFFFLRSADPAPHIRLRFRIGNAGDYAAVFAAVHRTFSACVDNGLLAKVTCDTYRRELERYGFHTMELSETLFGIDSRSVLELLSLLSEATDPESDRWQLSLSLLDDMLAAFGYDTEAKSALLESVSQRFRREFGCDRQPFSKQLDDKYRTHRTQIEATFAPDWHTAGPYADILERRKTEITALALQFQEQENAGRLTVSMNSLIPSYLHMTMNRLFRSKNRQFEMVIYHFLDKYYKSALARKKYMKR